MCPYNKDTDTDTERRKGERKGRNEALMWQSVKAENPSSGFYGVSWFSLYLGVCLKNSGARESWMTSPGP